MNFAKQMTTIGILGLAMIGGLGCDKAPETLKKSEEAAVAELKKAEEAAKKGMEAAKKFTVEEIAKLKEEFATHSGSHLEGFEAKIKELSGEAATEAQTLFAALKEKLTAIKDAAPEKFHELKVEAEEKITELKKKLGM